MQSENNPIEGQAGAQQQITYSGYLHLPELTACQHPMSGEHDEMLFIIIHQAAELWMKLCLHELNAARRLIAAARIPAALKMLSRVIRAQGQMTQSWDVLATMTPADYISFRSFLGSSSGFQSAQYRAFEFMLGAKNPAMLGTFADTPDYDLLADELRQPSLYDEVQRHLSREGFSIPQAHLDRDFSLPYEASPEVEDCWVQVYRDTERFWPLYELAEKLVDLEYHFQRWRFGHVKTVERIIGFKQGTGGTSGVAYLERALKQQFFPELLSARTAL